MTAIRDLANFNAVHGAGLAKLLPPRPRIAVGMGTCGSGNGAEAVMHAFAEAIQQRGLDIDLIRTGCFGFCAEEPLVNLRLPGQPLVILHRVRVNHVDRILDDLAAKTVPAELALCRIEDWNHLTSHVQYGAGFPDIPLWNEVPFFRGQKKIVLRNAGLINPDDIEEYIAVGGYQALYKVLIDGTPEAANDQIKQSGLRGRGGAGYSTGLKWEFLRKAKAERKFLICNADEGDPGAYMNRNEIESDPHALIEGMAIGAYITGATDGVIYIRAEYPLAVHQLTLAIGQAREYGLLGKDILGRGFSFDIDIVEGAGAFVCGEETALIASLEGRAGRPRPRPPFPAQKGLWGYPTTSTTSKPGSTSRPSSPWDLLGSRKPAGAPAPAPRSSLWSARCATPGSWKCRSARRSAPSSTRSAAAACTAIRSRRCRPAGRRAAASRPISSRRRSTTSCWASSARSWARAAWR